MKILSTSEIRDWDTYSMAMEPITSFDLMERAAKACVQWISDKYDPSFPITILCGKGNNGGDGLAIARLLARQQYQVSVYILETGAVGTTDFEINKNQLDGSSVPCKLITQPADFPHFAEGSILIDALYGIGINRVLTGLSAQLVRHVNTQDNTVVSIDMPSGLLADDSSNGFEIIEATHTLTFQVYKVGLLLSQNAPYFGEVHILDIGLHQQFYEDLFAQYETSSIDLIQNIYMPRKPFSHKGNYGHAALIAGSTGMMGAAVLSALGCTHAGVGKLTTLIPRTGYEIMQIRVPEAMAVISGFKDYIEALEGLSHYKAIGIGPGIGVIEGHEQLLRLAFLETKVPFVIDADALNVMAKNPLLLNEIPPYSVLTPHPLEFDRLFGVTTNEFERLHLASYKAKEYKIIIVLKGHHTFIATPGGKGFFNLTGNAGMAKGGSGDVLTGIILSLLAQGYQSVEAAILGVYLHGYAGDVAAQKFSQESMLPQDIIQCLGDAFKALH